MNIKNLSKQIIVVLVSLAVVAYLGLQLSLSVGTILDIDYATVATANESLSANAYFFRDEVIIPSPYFGTSTYFYSDGEKVPVGAKLANVYASKTDAGIQSRINEINEKIKILELSSPSQSYSTGDITRMDEEISKAVFDIVAFADKGHAQDALIGRRELLITLNRRRAVLTSTSGFDMQIDNLKREKLQLEAKLTGESAEVLSTQSGIFYSVTDGYENVFTRELIENMTLSAFEELQKAVPDKSITENSVGKLLVSSKWYIAISVDEREAAKLTENKSEGYYYSVSFPYSSGKTVPMRIEKKISQTDRDTVVLVLSSGEPIDGLDMTRSQPVKILKKTYEGLKVPVSALRIVDGVKGVYSLDGNVVVFKETNPIFTDNGYYICEFPDPNNMDASVKGRLSLHDVIITSDKGVEVGKVVS